MRKVYKHNYPGEPVALFSDGYVGGVIEDLGVHDGVQYFAMEEDVAAQVNTLAVALGFSAASQADVDALKSSGFAWSTTQRTALGL